MGGWADGLPRHDGDGLARDSVCLTDCRVTPRQRFPRHARLVFPGHGPDGVGEGLL